MNIKLKIILFIILLAFLSCESDKKFTSQNKEKETVNQVSPTTNISKINDVYNYSIDLTSGEYYCFIDTLIEENDGIYLIVDFVNYLIGEEAYNEAMINKDYFIDGKDTIVDTPNDCYISNNNTKLRKFRINNKTKISTYYTENGEKKEIPLKSFLKSLSQFDEIDGLFFLEFNNGEIISIEDVFLP
jgi:hypothetical protein